jgi:hypothetical protein
MRRFVCILSLVVLVSAVAPATTFAAGLDAGRPQASIVGSWNALLGSLAELVGWPTSFPTADAAERRSVSAPLLSGPFHEDPNGPDVPNKNECKITTVTFPDGSTQTYIDCN